MCLSKLLPIGDGAAYHSNTAILLLTGMVLFIWDRQWRLATVFACLASLTQQPTILYVGVLLVLGLWWAQDRRALLRLLLAYGVFLAALVAVATAAYCLTGERMLGQTGQGADSARFGLVREALRSPAATVPYLAHRVWVFGLLVLTGTGFLPLALLGGCGRRSLWIMATTVVYLLPVSVGHIYRLHYAAIPATMLCAAAVRSVAEWSTMRRRLVGPLAVATCAACAAYVGTASMDPFLNFGDRVVYSALLPAIADGFLARGERLAAKGHDAAAIRDFKHATLEDPRFRPVAYANIVKAYVRLGRPDLAAPWHAKLRALTQTQSPTRADTASPGDPAR